MSGAQLSKEFFELVKAIGESKTKQEEDRIIQYEVTVLKKKLTDRSFMEQEKKVREFLIRMLYVEMLGHDASFGYIKAVEMVASANLLNKRVGYLCASLCFSPEHELRLMLISRLQKDMQSSNVLEVTTACIACCKLMTEDMIPAVLPIVLNLMKHDQEIVRKKAVMVMHRFYQVAPASVAHMGDKFRRILCDKDPSVMGASLHVLYDLALADPISYKDLVASFVSILKQITEHRLPREFDYHRIPAPWIQMQLLRLLAVLGKADQAASEGMYEVILDCMRRADIGISVGYAIIYECVRTVTTIYPNATLLDAAAAAIARFISSDNHNLKYLGVTGLAAIVKEHPKYAVEHQMTVIDCLQDPDETLQRKTLDLLYGMTNPANVEVVVDKMVAFLRSAVDTFLRSDLVSRITSVAERFAPSNEWFIHTMTEVFELGGDLVRPETANNLMRLISEGTGEDEEQDAELRRFAVETYLTLMSKPALPDTLLQTMFWVLGEYGYVSTTTSLDTIATRVCELASSPTMSAASRGYAITAALKLSAQLGRLLPAASQLVQKYSTSKYVEVAQRCNEFRNLTLNAHVSPETMVEVLPVDASSEDIDVDEYLEFLNPFVQQALAHGGHTYSPPVDDDDESGGAHKRSADAGGLRFEAYERPEEPVAAAPMMTEASAPTFGMPGAGAHMESAPAAAPSTTATGLNLGGVKAVWGAAGYMGNLEPAHASAPAPAGIANGSGITATPEAVLKRPWDFTPEEAAAAQALAAQTNAAINNGDAASAPAPAPATPDHPRRAGHEPEKPRELTDKERMANALFAGLGGGSGATRKTGLSRGSSIGVESAPVPAPAPAPSGGMDMFSGMAVSAAAPPMPPKAAASGVDDLLGLGGPSLRPVVAPHVQNALMEAYGTAPHDPFAAPAPAPAPAPAARTPSHDDDPFSMLGGAPASAEAPSISTLSVPPILKMATAGHATSAVPKEFGSSGAMKAGGFSIIKDTSYGVVVFVVANGQALSHVTLQVAPPPFLAVASISADPSGAPSGTGRFTINSIPNAGTGCFAVDLSITSGPAPAAINFQLSADGTSPIVFTVPVSVMDTIRPARITTEQFGGAWGPHACERKAAITLAGLSGLPDFMARVAQINLHPVQSIPATQEAIAAGVIMGTPEQCLVHARLAGTTVHITVRTKNDAFSNTMLQAIGRALQG